MSGFWAGAVPPWLWVVGGCLLILAVLLGMWAGYERGFRHAEEEARWAREQAKARRTHPVYRPVEITYEERPAAFFDEHDLAVINSHAIDTGEIQAIIDRVDEWMATWIGDGHALSDG